MKRTPAGDAAHSDSLAASTQVAPSERAIRLPPGPHALGPDAIVNDRSGSCDCPSGLGSSQAETSVAAFGPYVLVSWNDRRGNCAGGTAIGMGHGWSTDYGATFRDGDRVSLPGQGGLRADPAVAVNSATGRWYIAGLGAGIGVLGGRFSGADFVLDSYRSLQPGQGESVDKPWLAVDPISNNVYVTWTRFPTDGSSAIDIQRLDADLNPLGPVQTLRTTPPYTSAVEGVQSSYAVVGPDGELYVGWGRYTFTRFGGAPSFLEVVRSNDFGQTFGPVQIIAQYHWAIEAVPTAFQRGFWPNTFALAVDRSNGPHRGRLYASWSETVDLRDLVLTGGRTVYEVENNDFFASATPIVPGDRVYGSVTAPGSDFYRFHGTKGQVFAVLYNSVPPTPLNLRLLCARDTSSTATYQAITIGGPSLTGLPYDGDYYLQIEAPTGGYDPYNFTTALDPPTPGQRARDIRDPFLAWSDDGVTWSNPVRLDDGPPGTDAVWTQVSVDGSGRVHCFWFDWRDDPECGVISDQYMVSSGDGGVSWGPNRKLTDQRSFWGLLASCSIVNLGDYMHMAAAGDYVYAAFPDARLGDPDVVVDASRFAAEQSCPADRLEQPRTAMTLDFTLTNRGNFATPLAWRVTDSRGWVTTATPSADGSQMLAPDESVVVQASMLLPEGCGGDSTFVRFITADPHVPGLEETCVTVVRCDPVTPTLVALVEATVQGRDVSLRWHGSEAAGEWASVARRTAGGEWAAIGRIQGDASGVFAFVDRGVAPGRHVYRLAGESDDFSVETAVEVRTLALAVERTWVQGGSIEVQFVLPSSRPAVLELVDVAGRVWARNQLRLEAGPQQQRLDSRPLPSGVYLLRLSQDGESVATKAIVTN